MVNDHKLYRYGHGPLHSVSEVQRVKCDLLNISLHPHWRDKERISVAMQLPDGTERFMMTKVRTAGLSNWIADFETIDEAIEAYASGSDEYIRT